MKSSKINILINVYKTEKKIQINLIFMLFFLHKNNDSIIKKYKIFLKFFYLFLLIFTFNILYELLRNKGKNKEKKLKKK